MERRELRQSERRWKTSKLEVKRQIFRAKRLKYSRVLADARATYHQPASVAQWAERRTRDREVPGSKLACAIWFFP